MQIVVVAGEGEVTVVRHQTIEVVDETRRLDDRYVGCSGGLS